MTDEKTTVDYYEIEDGNYIVIELYNSKDQLVQRIVIKRKAALQLAEGILKTLGKY